jgi:hypothetical protein
MSIRPLDPFQAEIQTREEIFFLVIPYAELVGADRAPHTPAWVWAGPGKAFFIFFFCFFLYVSFFYFSSFLYFVIRSMLKSL